MFFTSIWVFFGGVRGKIVSYLNKVLLLHWKYFTAVSGSLLMTWLNLALADRGFPQDGLNITA